MRRRPDEIETKSDADLLSASLRWPRSDFHGPTFFAMLPSSLVATWLFVDAPWYGRLLAGSCAAVPISIVASATSGALLRLLRGPDPFPAEFLRRRGFGSRAASAPTSPPPDIVLLFSGHALPHGGSKFAWIEIRLGPPAEGRLVHAVRRHSRVMPGPPPAIGESGLSAQDAVSIVTAVTDVRGPTDSNHRFEVRDGFPFDIVCHRRWETSPLTLTGNLAAGNRDEFGGCRLASAVLQALDVADSSPLPYGACDFKGNITLGEV